MAKRSRQEPEFRQVYFIQAEALGLVKIGCGDDARKRLATLQVGSPDVLRLVGVFHADDAPAFEAHLHRTFGHLRVRGEWFRPDEQMTDLMAVLCAPDERHIQFCLKPRDQVPGEPSFRFTPRSNESRRAMWRRFREEATAAGLH